MGDEFAHDVGRKLCLQLCSLAGYGAASESTLDVLSDLAKTFLRESSVAARSYAENAGRTDVNAKDVAMGLDDLGFSLEELHNFATNTQEIPFGTTVPKFPVLPAEEDVVSFKDTKQAPPEHVPSYLPVFPEAHTYRETALFVNKAQDEKTKALRAHEVKKTTEDVLYKLGGKTKNEDPFAAALEEGEDECVDKRRRKKASNWTELLLGRLGQNEGTSDLTARLLPNASLSSIASFDAQEAAHQTKRRKKEGKEKKVKTTTAPFSAMLKFNLQPTADESVNENPSIATEELEPLPTLPEASVGTEELDVFGGAEEIDSNDVLADDSSAPGAASLEAPAQEEIDEIRATTSKSDDANDA